MKLKKEQREELLRLIKDKPKNMRNTCTHYGVTIQEAQRYMLLATKKELRKLYDKEKN